VRKAQLGRVDDPVVEQKQIEIERALAPSNGTFPSESSLDLLKNMKQRQRFEICLEQRDGVQKHALARRSADGLGFMKSADLANQNTGDVT
jgi:hypothetical protein